MHIKPLVDLIMHQPQHLGQEVALPRLQAHQRFGSGGLVGVHGDRQAFRCLVLFDPEREWLVDATKFRSKARNCPWNGRTLKGMVLMTLLGGRVVCDKR